MSGPKDKKGYSTRWQDHPGYKTLVDMKSEKGILPEQTESGDMSKGQGTLDAIWPVQLSQTREKERALPLPSDHSKLRDKRIGPTYVNKPRKSPDRTLPEPGSEYGHPTKYDYNFPTRRQDVTGGAEEFDLEASVDNLIEMMGAYNAFPSPSQRQRNQGGTSKRKSEQFYRQHPQIKRRMKMKYRTKLKRNPKLKRKKKLYEKNPNRFERRGLGDTTPAARSRKWREERKKDPKVQREKRQREQKQERNERAERTRQAGLEALAEAFELLGLDLMGANWPLDWNTVTKETQRPEHLQQNNVLNGPASAVPRKDPSQQEGQPLRAPNLDEKHQKGLFTQQEPPAAGQLNIPTTNNPTDGSGKVIPMSYYTDIVNNTQAIPDGRQDRYERNTNFEVKQGSRKVAMTLDEVLERVDNKIKERARERPPTLLRTDTKNWIWHWKSGKHTVKLQAFKRGRAEKFPKLNLRISCSCPFWRWWGPEHWATQEGYQRGSLRGTGAYPQIRDPEHWRPVCKHAYAVLQKSKNFFVRPEKNPLKRLGNEGLPIEPLGAASSKRPHFMEEFLREVEGQRFRNPPTGNLVKFHSLAWEYQRRIYEDWKETRRRRRRRQQPSQPAISQKPKTDPSSNRQQQPHRVQLDPNRPKGDPKRLLQDLMDAAREKRASSGTHMEKGFARLLVDSLSQIEIEPVPTASIAHVAQVAFERELCRRVVDRYLAEEDT